MSDMNGKNFSISFNESVRNSWIWKDAERLKWFIDVIFEVESGNEIRSLMDWGIRWKSSKSKVDRFFRKMEKDGFIMMNFVEPEEENKIIRKRKPKQLNICKSDSCIVNKNEIESTITVKNIDSPIPEKKVKVTKKMKEQIKLQMGFGKDEIVNNDYKDCLDSYIQFYKQRNGIKPKVSSTDGTALKSLIGYFNDIIKDTGSTSKAVDAFKDMFSNWGKLDNFLQNKLKLSEINSNINNIISFIKNNNSNAPSSRKPSSIKTEPQDLT